MPSKSFWDHPIETIEEALSIRKQIASLQEKLNALFGNEVSSAAAHLVKAVKKRTRTMSAEARKRIASAQRARWAKVKGDTVAKAVSSSARKKRTLSPEAREKMAAAARARWAKVKGISSASAPAKFESKKKRTMSPEARAKIAAAAGARWAARRKGAAAPSAK